MPSCTCVCGARYRFAQESIGKKTKCRKCGVVFTLEAPTPGPIPLADEGIIPLAKDEPTDNPEMPSPGTKPGAASGVSAGTSPDAPSLPPGFVPPDVIIEPPERVRTYVGDLLESFVFMFRLESIMTFLFMWFILAFARMLLPFGGLMGMAGLFVVAGWYCAFRFEVVGNAAAGEVGLPEVSLSEGWVDGIIVPFFNWVGSWLIVMIPAGIGLGLEIGFGRIGLLNVVQMLTGDASTLIVEAVRNESFLFLGGLVLGLFMWPIIVLCFALGGVSSLGRLDLIVETVFKTFPYYVLTVLIIYATVALRPLGDLMGSGYMMRILSIGFGLYLELIGLRAVGLFYHHYKDKFAWSWG